MPDSRLSEWRMSRGTRGLLTTLEDRTGSVGESSAPRRNDSVQLRSVSSFAAAAMMIAVSGIASSRLRSGTCHAFWSISASTSRPSRKRMTISATIARSSTNVDRGLKSQYSEPAVAQHEAGDHEDGGEREEAAVREPGQQRANHQQRADCQRRVVELLGRGCRVYDELHARLHHGGRVSDRERGILEGHRIGQVALLAGRGRSVQRVPGRGGRQDAPRGLRERRVLEAADVLRLRRRRRGRHLPPARRPLPRSRPLRVRAHLRPAPAAGAGGPLARDRPPGAAGAARTARCGGELPSRRGRVGQRGPHRERVRPARVRRVRADRRGLAQDQLSRRPALLHHARDRGGLDQRGRALHLRGR